MWNPLETDETKQKRILRPKHYDDDDDDVVDAVQELSFSPDGRFLASADWSKEIIIWSTEVRNWVDDVSLDVCGVFLPIYE